MSKNDGFSREQLDLIDMLVNKRTCASKAEARRLVLCMPKDKILERISKTRILKKTLSKDQ